MQYDIFISYKRRGTSSATAAYLYELLLRKGFNVFFDRKEMRSGKFNEQLLEHISNATDIIILLEDGSLDSWFKYKNEPAGRGGEFKIDGEPPYMTDWFCKEIMHALSLEGKNIVPVLLNGYQMPDGKDLPKEMKDLSLHNALSLEISEIEEFYQKNLIDKEYLKSKPKNLAVSRSYQNKGAIVGSFLFYTEAESCELFERGERIMTLTDDNDEEHPFECPVTFAGEHRFKLINNDTCEEVRISRHIETNCQEYVHVEWTETQNLWKLTEEDIDKVDDADKLYRWGRGLNKGTAKNRADDDLAFLCLRRAMELGSDDAKVLIRDGYGNSKALRYWQAWEELAANLGNSRACRSLAIWYQRNKNIEEAEKWLNRAVEIVRNEYGEQSAEFCDTLVTKAEIIKAKEGKEKSNEFVKDLISRFELLDDVSDRQYVGFYYRVAFYYRHTGVKGYDHAILYYKKCLEKNDHEEGALWGLGHCYFYRSDMDNALLYWNKLYEIKPQHISRELSNVYKRIGQIDKAIEVLNHVEDYAGIGDMYLYGSGVPKDYAKAYEWYSKGAEKGHGFCMNQLGLIFENGLGVEQDCKKAFEWYKKAADQGVTSAKHSIGLMYANGKGVNKDLSKASEYWEQAANNNFIPSMMCLGQYYNQEVHDFEKARMWWQKAGDGGQPCGYDNIAWEYHLQGKYQDALTWADKAVGEIPDNPLFINTLATVYQDLDRKNDALNQFELCLKLLNEQGESEDKIKKTEKKIEDLRNSL